MNQYGFLKVAAAVPHVAVADCATNLKHILALAEKAVQRGVEIIAFPELSLTAYTCGDLLLQPALLDATEEALAQLVKRSRKLPLVMLVGAPLRHNSAIYNCALVIAQGRILGVVPKSYIPDYSEFFENRVFTSGAGITDDQI
ncbi:MAG: NAD(+) synthase, partial [Alistipes sp.]|nr:NAD(+) synthase [Alistipes sp.]